MSPGVFLSYRRVDSRATVGRLRDRLVQELSHTHVFYDVDSIEPGSDVRDVIRDTLSAVDAVLVVIGPQWAPERLGSPVDYVRLELLEADRQHKRIVPVLLEGAGMPQPDLLPVELEWFAYRNAMRLREGPDFGTDAARIVQFLRGLSPLPTSTLLPPTAADLMAFCRRAGADRDFAKQALADADALLNRSPADVMTLVARGFIYGIAEKSPDLALRDFEEAIRLDSAYSYAYHGRGLVGLGRNDLDGALADFNEAIRLDPTNSSAYNFRGNVRSDLNDLDGALADYNEAIRLDSTNSSAYNGRGNVRSDRNHPDGAFGG